jgi:hypothetical protein
VIGGNGGHFWIQHPRKHKVYQKYSMQLKKKIFLQTCVIQCLMSSEYDVAKKIEGSGRGLIWDTVSAFFWVAEETTNAIPCFRTRSTYVLHMELSQILLSSNWFRIILQECKLEIYNSIIAYINKRITKHSGPSDFYA